MSRRIILIALAAFVGFFVYIFGLYVKGTDAYSCSLDVARRSPAVVAELGEPMEAGFFAWISNYKSGGAVTDTSFRTTLEGPKGKGGLKVWWYSSPVGSALRMELERGGRRRVVYEGTIPCR